MQLMLLPRVGIPVCGSPRLATAQDSGLWRPAPCHGSGFRFVAAVLPVTAQNLGPWQSASCHSSRSWFVAARALPWVRIPVCGRRQSRHGRRFVPVAAETSPRRRTYMSPKAGRDVPRPTQSSVVPKRGLAPIDIELPSVPEACAHHTSREGRVHPGAVREAAARSSRAPASAV